MFIPASEARRLAAEADPTREHAEADTLAQSALEWALKNAEGRTEARIDTYARHGHTELSVKFAPGSLDEGGVGNVFYNDLMGNSNIAVADAIADIIYARPQQTISPIQEKRLLNTYNARLVKFIRDLTRAGYDVTTSEGERGNAAADANSLVISWA